MLGDTISEQAATAVLIARLELRRLGRMAARPFRLSAGFQKASPERLLIAPQDIRTADPTIAGDIYAGHLVFAGRFVDAHGQSPFDIAPPSRDWAEALHGFGWLRHLRAADTPLSRANARALVEDWISHGQAIRAPVAWDPEVVSRRLLSWLAQSPLILDPPDAQFYRKFMRSIGRQATFLQRALSRGLVGYRRLFAGIALAQVGLCAEGLPAARKQGSRVLIEELRRQILPDGGHISRDPSVLVTLLLDLLPLRQAYTARGAPVPPVLLNAIDRIIPMIRLFRHGDGTLALFNGMGVTEPDLLATVLSYDDAHAQALANAPHSGYQRLEAGAALAICDVGAPPPRIFSGRAHAGTLSFEFSTGAQRIIVNCGRPNSSSRRANDAARMTAAHSTLVLGEASSSRFAPPSLHRWLGEEVLSGPKTVTLTRGSAATPLTLEASHDGYARMFRLLHRRSLTLAQDGKGLYGRDEVVPAGRSKHAPPSRGFVLRFHLHPGVRTESLGNGRAVALTLPTNERWLFEADGTTVYLEESILFAVAEGQRRTDQIVVSGSYPERSGVSWSLTRVADPHFS